MEENARKFMSEALKLARENLEVRNGGPFGCVVVKDGEIIATGYNEVLSNNDPTCHAEIVAIRRACKKLNTFQLTGCEIYSSCEPCPMCMGAIYWARPEKMYYAAGKEDADEAGFDDHHIYQELEKPPARRKIEGVQLMREEGVAILRQWKESDLKINY
jgi:tRNA(Arg) A34 adenosine deaminase TadA